MHTTALYYCRNTQLCTTFCTRAQIPQHHRLQAFSRLLSTARFVNKHMRFHRFSRRPGSCSSFFCYVPTGRARIGTVFLKFSAVVYHSIMMKTYKVPVRVFHHQNVAPSRAHAKQLRLFDLAFDTPYSWSFHTVRAPPGGNTG